MQFKRDIQNEESLIKGLPINKVGIKNVLRKIEISKGQFQYSINVKISAYITLPGTQRGIHMSRTAESIEEVINSAIYRPARNVEEFCIRIVDALFRDHDYTDHAEVEMNGTIFIIRKPNERDQIQKAHEIYSKVIGDRDDKGDITRKVYVGVSALGITACPCAQEMSREYAKQIISSRDFNIDEEKIDEIINLIPIASHNQRAKGKIIVGNGNGEKELVDVLDLIDLIESSMSARIQSILKRPEESELVRVAHLNPMFVEDVVRNMAKKLASKKFEEIPDHHTIEACAETEESIHHHNAYAEINTTFKRLRETFNQGYKK
ncbi:MAG: GTP cyclohydrolase I FolE2 [Candidatus Lokiarchaeota archaeon]|nr:GTP cyclohydrolase I FolE2 [Candidatus Lokiarchaeota archaeon]